MAEMREKSKNTVSTWVIDNDVRGLLYNAKKSGKRTDSMSREINSYFRAKYSDSRLARKAELVDLIGELQTQLVAWKSELETIENQEKIEEQIKRKQHIQERSAGWHLLETVRSMRRNGKYMDPQNRDRLFPLYEQKLEKINFQRRKFMELLLKKQLPDNLDDIILEFSPSWKDSTAQKETEDRMMSDPEFVRTLEVQS